MRKNCQSDSKEYFIEIVFEKQKFHENAFENVVCKMVVILSGPHCVEAQFQRVLWYTGGTVLLNSERSVN